jgi:hypothetical protein
LFPDVTGRITEALERVPLEADQTSTDLRSKCACAARRITRNMDLDAGSRDRLVRDVEGSALRFEHS